MKNEVNRAPNIGAKKHKFSSFLTHKGRWFLATLTLLFTLSIGQMWGANIFSAVANSSSDVSVNSKAQVQFTSSQATVSGGKLYYTVTGTSNRAVLDDSQGPSGKKKKVFGLNGNDVYFSVKLNTSLSEGDTVYAEMYDARALWFTASSTVSRPSSAPATATNTGATSSAWNTVKYIVAKNSILDGVDTLHIWRGTGNNTYLSSIWIAQKVTATGYAISTSTANGTIAVTDGSSAITSAEENDVVHIAATPNTGYGFTSWDVYKTSDATTKVSLAADDDSDNKTRKFTMPAYPVTVGATFSAINYTVTHNAASNGSYTIKVGSADATDENTTAQYGQTVTLAANPATGYVFSGWTVLQGETPVSVTNNQFTMPDGNVTVSATFDENACPTSGVVFSASVSATSKLTVTASTTDQLLTASQATVSGGSMYVTNEQNKDKDLIAQSGSVYYFCETNNDTYFKIVLDCELQAGDRIVVDAIGGTREKESVTYELGVWFSSASSRPGSAPAAAGTSTSTSLVEGMIDYIVTSTDEYVGKKTFYIYRAYGATQYFGDVTITRPYNISYVSAKGTAQTTPTKGFEVALTQITGVDGWSHTGWTANKAVTVGTTDYAAGVEIPASATAKLSDDTQFTAVWEEIMSPAVTPSISAHPATASYTWKQTIQALTVTASVTDGGTLHYQWYKEAGENDTKVGTDANSYTPEEAGTYYVVVTNKKTGYEDASATSANAVITVAARPSYTVTYYDGASPIGSESVLEDASPAEYAAKQTKAYHEFVNWKNNADVVITPASLVVTKDTALYGNWTGNYAFGDYSFVNVAEVGTTPNKLTMTDGTTVNVPAGSRVDNIYFSAMAIKYESGASSVLTDYKGWKINTNNATISFLVENDAQVKVGIGQKTDLNVSYTNTESTAQNVSLTQQSEGSYNVKGGTIVTLTMTSNNTTTLKYIKIGDIPAESDDASLSDLKVGGTTITGFSSSKYQYYVELPYGTAHADFPVVTVTTNEEHATAVVNNAKDREDNMTVVHVTAQDGVAEKYYNVYFSVAPKLGVEVFAYTPVGSNGFKDATGYKGGKADIYLQTSKTQGGYKLGSVGHYIGIAVDGGLKANDLICIDIADLQGASALTFFDGKTDGKTQVITPAPTPKVGKNYVTVPSDMDSIYLYRADGTCNPSVISVAVYREMESFFETFTVAGVDATIDETVSPKTITVEVPAVTDITALTPTYKAWANGGATVSPTTAQDFSAGAVEYTVTSAYSEATTYQVTVTKAAAIKEVVISGTLTVQEDATTTLSAVVYDTNDDEAANQNVTWSVKAGDTDLASVDANGVVTGKAVGTAHIIATSVADNTKSAEVAVVVTENPCRTWNAPATSWSTAVVTVGKLQIARGDCPASSSVTPYSDASSVYGIKIDGSAKFIELTMSDGAQFESLTLGAASGSNGSSPKYVVVASAAKTFASSAVLSAVEYVANAKDAEQSLNVIDLPTGTRNVRLYRSYEDKGAGTSVFLYYVNACKKEFVPVTAVAVADGNLAIGKSLTLSATTTPVNADIASYVWTIESATATGVTIDGNVLTAAAAATEGEVVVKVVATDVLSNVVQTTATISIVNKFETVKPVTGTTTWDWEPVSVLENGPTITLPDTVLANYISGEIWEMLAGGNGDRPYRGTDNKAFQGKTLYFNTTVPGKLRMYAGRISNDQKVYVNGIEVGKVTSTKGYLNEIVVPAGNVYITAGTNGMRIYNMTFDTNLVPAQAEESFLQGYERTVNPQYYGTICLPKAGVMTGAMLFQVAYMDYKEDGVTPYKVYYDEVENGTMQAGMPYIFLAEQSTIGVYYTGTAEETAKDHNGLHGTLTDITSGMNAAGIYMLYNNQVLHSTHPDSQLPANRAYLKIDEIPGFGNQNYQAPAPKFRRISTGFNAPQIATGIDAVETSDAPRKIMIDGTMYILRGEKMYDATGRLVK